ncbi:MAG: hypothetical protein A2W90_21295 [Bacteroidetes bacterium GWF2_42_66]|nr:MAG: hypothetical protein A2W90_21295 [Bacteroidetes bacterium GWF2_42_66]
MSNFRNTCFVCNSEIQTGHFSVNPEINLPVCEHCRGSEEEKEAVRKLTEGLADGFVCGCI